MAKYLEPSKQFDEHQLQWVEQFLIKKLTPVWTGSKPVSREVVVSRINWAKSPGFPYYFDCDTKGDAFQKHGAEIWSSHDAILNGNADNEPHIFACTLKDEIRPIEKVREKKTRPFNAAGTLHLTVSKTLFTDQGDRLMNTRGKGLHPFTIGIGVPGPEFVNTMLSLHDNIYETDIGGCDARFPLSIARVICNVRSYFLPSNYQDSVRLIYAWAYCGYSCILGKVFSCYHNKSGWELTAWDTCLYLWGVLNLCFATLYPQLGFEDAIRMIINGDDSLFSERGDELDLNEMAEWLLQYNIRLEFLSTASRRITDVSFLSHSIKYRWHDQYGDFVVTAGNLSKLISSINFVPFNQKLGWEGSCLAHLLGLRICLWAFAYEFEEINQVIDDYLSCLQSDNKMSPMIYQLLKYRVPEHTLFLMHTKMESMSLIEMPVFLFSPVSTYVERAHQSLQSHIIVVDMPGQKKQVPKGEAARRAAQSAAAKKAGNTQVVVVREKAPKQQRKKPQKTFGPVNRGYTLNLLEQQARMIESSIALPEKCTPIRLPTKYSATKTAVFGPMPRVTNKNLGVVTPVGTPVVTNGQAFTAYTNHPFVSEIGHVIPGGSIDYYLEYYTGGALQNQWTLALCAANSIPQRINFAVAVPTVQDTTSVHGSMMVLPAMGGRRGFWLGQGQSLVVYTTASAQTVYMNLYKWTGKVWTLMNTTNVMSLTTTASTDTGLTNTGTGGFFAIEMGANSNFAVNLRLNNKTYGTSGGFTSLPSGFTSGTTATNNFSQEVFTFKTVDKLSTFLGSFESARVNCGSLRATCSASFLQNGGTIDMVQLPQGTSPDDLLQSINQNAGDALSTLAQYPGRRFEAIRSGTYGPLIPDGPKYFNYKDIVDVDEEGTIEDLWWDCDKRITMIAFAASAPVPTATQAANSVVVQTYTHMEAPCTNQAFATDNSPYDEMALDRAIKRLQSVCVLTENPEHVLGILGQIWNGARSALGVIGPALGMTGNGYAVAAGGLATLASMLPAYTGGSTPVAMSEPISAPPGYIPQDTRLLTYQPRPRGGPRRF